MRTTLLQTAIRLMKYFFTNIFLFVFFASLSIRTSYGQTATSYVDPRIGNVGAILEPTRPTAQQPNQLIRSYPERKDHLDDQIRHFHLTLISHRLGQLFGIMPFTGKSNPARMPISASDPENEVLSPYYYSEWLEDYNITTEFAPGCKAGYFRVQFPKATEKNIFLKIINDGNWKAVSNKALVGEEVFDGMKAWVYAELNQPFSYRSDKNKQGVISWPTESANVVEFKYAISFISADQAKQNLLSEIPAWSFDGLKAQAKLAWDKVLNKIEVKGGTEARKRTFYTALYRSYERMVDITENGRYYSNYDKKVHTTNRPFFVDDWIWDTYLALHPLRFILSPEMEGDMIQSYVSMYEQSGWLPQFPVLWGDNPCMNGFHSTIMMLDAYRKGIRNFDVQKAYEGMRKNATQATMLPWKNGPMCSLDSFYHKNGFYPSLRPGEKESEPMVHGFENRQSVAITLGHSFDDWALGQMAGELGKNEDYITFNKRSGNYKNLYNKEKNFFMPKSSDGNWIDMDPTFDGGMGGREYYDENNGWTYLWQVQHNIPGLMDLMGGTKSFENRLDQLFRESLGRSKYQLWAKFPDFTGIVGQFSMGNEPSFHIPYLYNFTDAPWKTQKRIRMLLNTWFTDNIFGIPGDEDGGGMSAFVVFSSMGFYPVVPGVPVYTIGSPVFEQTTIHLPNGKNFIVSAPGCSETNKYIQEAYLNGKPLKGPWFTHSDLIKGGELKLIMGALPNKSWGVDFDFKTIYSNELSNLIK
jgi:predicted alpha-1,2-mannosidase